LKASLESQPAPASELQAVALAAAVNEDKTGWADQGTYRVVVNGDEFLVDLKKETVPFR